MGRYFSFEYQQRNLVIAVIPIDEGWELWIMEKGHRLARGALVSIDDATDAGRLGQDRISAVAEQVKARVLNTELRIDAPPSDTAETVWRISSFEKDTQHHKDNKGVGDDDAIPMAMG